MFSYYAQSWTALFRAFSSYRQPSASLTKLFPSCCVFFITKLRQTEHNVSQLFSMLINFYSLIKGIPQLDKTLDKTLGRTGQTLVMLLNLPHIGQKVQKIASKAICLNSDFKLTSEHCSIKPSS